MADGVIILGCHRSGTSAIAGTCHEFGFRFGDNLLAVSPDNPKGYFERYQFLKLNDGLMELFLGGWASPLAARTVDFAALAAGDYAAELIAELKAGIDEVVAGDGYWAIKDPRISRLLPVWYPLLPAGARLMLVLRHPVETMASMVKRDGFGDLQAGLIWLLHTIEPIRFARAHGLTLSFVDYAASLRDPTLVARRLTAMDFTIAAGESGFIDPKLQRNFSGPDDAEAPLSAAAVALFETLARFDSTAADGFEAAAGPLIEQTEALIARISAEDLLAELAGVSSLDQRVFRARHNIEDRESSHKLWQSIHKSLDENNRLWKRVHASEAERDKVKDENAALWKRVHGAEALHASMAVDLRHTRARLATIESSYSWRGLRWIHSLERRLRKLF